jgi:hypothetical protein
MSATELIARLPRDRLGGAQVFRPVSIGGRMRKIGETISADELRAVPKQNLRALMDQRFIVAWPVGTASAAVVGDVFVVNRPGTSHFDVIVGRKINADPLSKVAAEELAKGERPAAA